MQQQLATGESLISACCTAAAWDVSGAEMETESQCNSQNSRGLSFRVQPHVPAIWTTWQQQQQQVALMQQRMAYGWALLGSGT
jgi:hypothetical protein